MGFSDIFIARPVATSLIMLGITLTALAACVSAAAGGAAAADRLPDDPGLGPAAGRQPGDHGLLGHPTVGASIGADPRVHADDLEQHAGNSSTSSVQFDLARNIDGAAQDVQTAINAAGGQLPRNLPRVSRPSYRKVNPTDSPVLIFLASPPKPSAADRGRRGHRERAGAAYQPDLGRGAGQCRRASRSRRSASSLIRPRSQSLGLSLEGLRTVLASATADLPRRDDRLRYPGPSPLMPTTRSWRPPSHGTTSSSPIKTVPPCGFATWLSCGMPPRTRGSRASPNGQPAITLAVLKQPGANVVETVDRIKAALPQLEVAHPPAIRVEIQPTCGPRPSGPRSP